MAGKRNHSGFRTPEAPESDTGSDKGRKRKKLIKNCKRNEDSNIPCVHISIGKVVVKAEKPLLLKQDKDKAELLPRLMSFLAVLHLSLPLVPSLIPTQLYQVRELAEETTQDNEKPDCNTRQSLKTGTKSSKRVRFESNSSNNDKTDENNEHDDDDDESADEEGERPRIPGKTGDGWIVEGVRDYRITQNNKVEYRTKWKHWPERFNSWEPESNFISKTPIEDYWQEVVKKSDKLNAPFKLARKCREKNNPDQIEPSYFYDHF
ncbi:Chromo domain protein LHP1 [Orchesella cincta]|uniref:Chromo domain protein LHP1 n=1 Tax=Orchesella cincta TaxID=48709 RepID=A0A1D2MBU9_ORCCI|nr:Chromo domain protein LHP1 [Orchesella cincta]